MNGRKQAYVANCEQINDSNTGCLIHNNKYNKTCECRAYLTMTIPEKHELLKSKFACFCCLTPNHRAVHCPQKRECGDGCYKYHHRSLHSSDFKDTSNTLMNDWADEYDKTVILPVMKVKTHFNSFKCFVINDE